MIKTITVKEAFEQDLYRDNSVYLYSEKDIEEAKQGNTEASITDILDDIEDDGVVYYSMGWQGGAFSSAEADVKLIVMPSYESQTRTIEELEARYEHMRRALYETEWQLALEWWASPGEDYIKLEKELNEKWRLNND